VNFIEAEDKVHAAVESIVGVPVYSDARAEIEVPGIIIRFSGTEYDYKFYRESPQGAEQIGPARVTHTVNIIITTARASDSVMRAELARLFERIKSLPQVLTDANPDERWYWDSVESQEYDGELVDSPRSVNCVIAVDEII